ncbi:MAG: type II secretion system F family protein [Gammaproteobacteria bacterium]|jgi:tight adherence protein C
MEPTTIILILIIGLAVGLASFGLSSIVAAATDPVRQRVAAATGSESAGAQSGWDLDISKYIQPVAKYVLPSKEAEQNKTLQRLIQAGYRSKNALNTFYAIKALTALVMPVGAYIAVRWYPELSSTMVLFIVVMSAMVGVRLPDAILGKIREKRMKRLRVAFPDALDLLVVCVESGLGLGPAIERVARELEISHKDLAQELSLVTAEIGAGVERPVALRNLADRCGLEDIKGLVGLLVQTIKFGTSVADALRVYSEEFRDKRMQKAEEEAAKIGTKMIFPLVFCMFPSFFIVAIGPAVMQFIEAFKTM